MARAKDHSESNLDRKKAVDSRTGCAGRINTRTNRQKRQSNDSNSLTGIELVSNSPVCQTLAKQISIRFTDSVTKTLASQACLRNRCLLSEINDPPNVRPLSGQARYASISINDFQHADLVRRVTKLRWKQMRQQNVKSFGRFLRLSLLWNCVTVGNQRIRWRFIFSEKSNDFKCFLLHFL